MVGGLEVVTCLYAVHRKVELSIAVDINQPNNEKMLTDNVAECQIAG
jgi:hypothetical protein